MRNLEKLKLSGSPVATSELWFDSQSLVVERPTIAGEHYLWCSRTFRMYCCLSSCYKPWQLHHLKCLNLALFV